MHFYAWELTASQCRVPVATTSCLVSVFKPNNSTRIISHKKTINIVSKNTGTNLKLSMQLYKLDLFSHKYKIINDAQTFLQVQNFKTDKNILLITKYVVLSYGFFNGE